MWPDDLFRLRHMVEAARETIGFARGRSREDLNHDRQLVWALVNGIEIIGEAAYQMAPDSRVEFPDIPRDDIVGMCHRLVHAYFDINMDILSKTVKGDLPILLKALEPLVPPEEA